MSVFPCQMELQLALALPINPTYHKKRTFSQLLMMDHAAPPESTLTDHVMLPTLSLLPLTPNHHHDDDHHSQCSNITKDDEEEESVVGWPPVNYHWRKKLRVDEVVGNNNNNNHMVSVADHRHHSVYVKVKMEGVGIARKVDLSMHQSFHTLKQTLMDMFGKCNIQQSNNYELAYLDKEGDWLLAQDLPWRQKFRWVCAKTQIGEHGLSESDCQTGEIR
ncbi:Auxin-responsive protein IAA29 [Glycine soja]